MAGLQSADSSYTFSGKRYNSTIEGGDFMIGWAVTFFVIALIAAFFGFVGIAGAAIEIAKFLFYIFLILFLISLVMGLMRR